MSPFFERGNKEEIECAKREYRKIYKREWKRSKRTTAHEVTLLFDIKEYQEILAEAKRHKRKVTPFIKGSCFAYMRKAFLVPNEESIAKIMQLLQMMCASLTIAIEDGEKSVEFARLRNTIEQLETEIRHRLINPPLKE